MNISTAASAPPGLRVIHVGDGIATAQLGNTCIVLWRGGAVHARFALQRAALEAVCTAQREGVGFLCVIERTSEPPSEELRKAAGQMLKDHQAVLRGAACVIEGDGFRASLARTVLRSIDLLLGDLPFPTRFYARDSEAAAWLATRTRSAARPIIESVAKLRAELTRADGGEGAQR